MTFDEYRTIMHEVIAFDVQEIERTQEYLVPQETRSLAVAQAETQERYVGKTVTMETEKTLDIREAASYTLNEQSDGQCSSSMERNISLECDPRVFH